MKHTSDFLGCDPLAAAETLERLAADLRRLAAGNLPTSSELRDAPMLRNWSFVRRQRACLTGTTFNHPCIGDGRTAVTSELFAIDHGRRWVRTMSRFYELGPATLQGLPN